MVRVTLFFLLSSRTTRLCQPPHRTVPVLIDLYRSHKAILIINNNGNHISGPSSGNMRRVPMYNIACTFKSKLSSRDYALLIMTILLSTLGKQSNNKQQSPLHILNERCTSNIPIESETVSITTVVSREVTTNSYHLLQTFTKTLTYPFGTEFPSSWVMLPSVDSCVINSTSSHGIFPMSC